MGAVICSPIKACVPCVTCGEDDALPNSSSANCCCIAGEDDGVSDSAPLKCCASDGAEEEVFYPEEGRTKYMVVGLGGATIRTGEKLDSAMIKTLGQGTVVDVEKVRARRAQITHPVRGWGSVSTGDGYVIMEPVRRPTKYQVVYSEGAFIRNAADIDHSKIVKVVQCGAILKSTGKVQIFDGIERVEVEGGWVSMRLREDRGRGGLVLKPID
ncbi:unnamed protein product [Discosporangium mesarthrocarpum]